MSNPADTCLEAITTHVRGAGASSAQCVLGTRRAGSAPCIFHRAAHRSHVFHEPARRAGQVPPASEIVIGIFKHERGLLLCLTGTGITIILAEQRSRGKPVRCWICRNLRVGQKVAQSTLVWQACGRFADACVDGVPHRAKTGCLLGTSFPSWVTSKMNTLCKSRHRLKLWKITMFGGKLSTSG